MLCAFKFLKIFTSLRFEFWREIGEKEKRRKGERDAFRAENDGVDSIDVVVTELQSRVLLIKLILAKVLVPGTLGVFSGFVFAD